MVAYTHTATILTAIFQVILG